MRFTLERIEDGQAVLELWHKERQRLKVSLDQLPEGAKEGSYLEASLRILPAWEAAGASGPDDYDSCLWMTGIGGYMRYMREKRQREEQAAAEAQKAAESDGKKDE